MRPTPTLAALSTTAACLVALTATSCGSDSGAAAEPPETPTVPTGVTVYTSTSTSVHVMWNKAAAAENVRRYEVYSNGKRIQNVPAAKHMIDITGLEPSTRYAFAVRARDADGKLSGAGRAEPVTTPSADADDNKPPTQPATLKARADGPRSATLTWTKAEDNKGVTAYDIYQEGTKIHSAGGNETSASVTTLRPDTRYTFTVKARDAADNSGPESPSATVTTESEPEGKAGAEVATDLQGTAREQGGAWSLELVWNAPKAGGDITEYEVYVDGKFGSKLVLGESAPKDTGRISLPLEKTEKATYAVKVRAKLPDGKWGPFTKEIEVTAGG
ncbi:fibronectin type III domain-containing protein [Streptomyces sp. WMMC500]|uniref:fibronectin type III domain-containing protein n=1 Tax=Streptomyces sp. WMMC500 TaxID=3015154 RepID=UPI00248CF748|nr:fibronectin type III domain-containing protein [Streptomyces sp. WMMC500]WBB63176.1 fibronectin type III domain-containing protein [Streptomyces sp. WMMC500]